MKNKTRFTTHIKRLSSKFNLKIENIMYYAKNNNLSQKMTKRLIDKYKNDCEDYICKRYHQ